MDPSYKKPRITSQPKVDARTLGIGNSNTAAQATDRRNQFNEIDLTQVPQANERPLNQGAETGMRTHAQEAMSASTTMGRGENLHTPDGSDINGAGEKSVSSYGPFYQDQAYGGVYSKRY